jgi:hypothetical protein
MAKVFNVDALAKEERSIVLKGVTHEVVEMSVDSYLKTMAIALELDKDENKSSQEAQISAVLKTIVLGIPTVDEATLRALPFDQMNAIAQFVRGEVPDALKEVVATVEIVTPATEALAKEVEAKND